MAAVKEQQAVQRLCGDAQTQVVRTEAGILPIEQTADGPRDSAAMLSR